MSVRDLMRRDLVALSEYPETPPIEELERRLGKKVVKLDSNENPYGPSPTVFEALQSIRPERYPDAECTELRRLLGEYVGVDPRRIVCSNGGDEMLDLFLRLFTDRGDEVIDLTPSFVMYELCTIYSGARLVRVPRAHDFAVDVPALERAVTPRTKLIFLCSPNNPTGNATSREDVIRVLETGRIVVLDEAYAEFAGDSLLDLAECYPNLIVFRTMSKWAALAGMRLGYAIVDPDVAVEMRKIRSPYNVGIAAQVAGIASLRDRAYLLGNVAKIIAERERLYERLARLPVGRVLPSLTNFLYWQTGGPSARQLKAELADRGVMVRAFPLPVEALRFSVGLPEESDILMRALEEVLADATVAQP